MNQFKPLLCKVGMFFLLIFSYGQMHVAANQHSTQATVKAMSLNVYGWKTLPQQADSYAKLIHQQQIQILMIQEGVDDWQLSEAMPVDYQRAESLLKSLGECWQRQWQIFINTCSGNRFLHAERFDLADGPNATRTGEIAEVITAIGRVMLINIHWDHESEKVRNKSAKQTAAVIKRYVNQPLLLAGDFNLKCSQVAPLLKRYTDIELRVDAGIDCLFSRGVAAQGDVVDAKPSDHPAIIAELFIVQNKF